MSSYLEADDTVSVIKDEVYYKEKITKWLKKKKGRIVNRCLIEEFKDVKL